ncbi:6-phosphogluconolactonase [Candidatus Woesearchaeota archaeon]|nr:6-phosphogluconolactonase [Candidatus Woesearchaeota archaeon]
MKTIKASTKQIDKIAAELIEDEVKDALGKKDNVIIGIPGGRSVQGIFSELKTSKIPWEKVHIFMVDERLVSIENEQSNYKGAYNSFIKDLIERKTLPEENAHPFIYTKPLEEYEKEFLKIGDKFDIVVLGVGEDGHIASLFPENDVVDNHSGYFVKIKDAPKPPPERMSASRKLLEQSNVSIILFLGEGKKEAYKNFKNENLSVETCPARIVLNNKTTYVMTNL